MIDLIQRLHISWFHAQHLRMIETFSFLWWENDHPLHQAHFQFLRVYLKSLRVYLMSLRNLHFQQPPPNKFIVILQYIAIHIYCVLGVLTRRNMFLSIHNIVLFLCTIAATNHASDAKKLKARMSASEFNSILITESIAELLETDEDEWNVLTMDKLLGVLE